MFGKSVPRTEMSGEFLAVLMKTNFRELKLNCSLSNL